MRQFRSFICLMALAYHWPAFADESSKEAKPVTLPRSDQLIFGFERLRWGMSPAEVRAAYPALNFAKPNWDSFPLTNLPSMYVSDYSYEGCAFDGVLRFDGDKLRSVEFDTARPDPNRAVQQPLKCDEKMRREFASKYGTPVTYFKHDRSSPPPNWHPFDGYYGNYKGTLTTASFESPVVTFGFSDSVNKPQIIIYDTVLKMPPQPPQSDSH